MLIDCIVTENLLLRPFSALAAAVFLRCPFFKDVAGIGCLTDPFAAGRHVTT